MTRMEDRLTARPERLEGGVDQNTFSIVENGKIARLAVRMTRVENDVDMESQKPQGGTDDEAERMRTDNFENGLTACLVGLRETLDLLMSRGRLDAELRREILTRTLVGRIL